jgi:CRP/FNR family cyclic AMP-dependent transcriptional regulator
MADAPRSRPAKRSTNRKAASEALFDPAVFLETTANGRVIATHSKKEVIFAQGDDADAVFYIRKGKVKVAIVSKEGKEAVIALLGPDEFVGGGCLIGQPKRLATASAMTECETIRMTKTEIQRVLDDEPAFSQMFVSHILARNARIEETWPISSSTQQKNGWPGCCCCWPILERKAERSQFSQRSVRRHSPR